MAVHPYASIVSDGADLDEVYLIKQLRKCKKSVLTNRERTGRDGNTDINTAFILRHSTTLLFVLLMK